MNFGASGVGSMSNDRIRIEMCADCVDAGQLEITKVSRGSARSHWFRNAFQRMIYKLLINHRQSNSGLSFHAEVF